MNASKLLRHSSLRNLYPGLVDVTTTPPPGTAQLPNVPVYLGIELEYERTRMMYGTLNKILRNDGVPWTAVADHSLRGDDAVEVKSARPMLPVEVERELPTLMIRAKDWTVNKRTGLHVHLDIGHTTHDNLVNLLCIYALLEPVVFAAAGGERSANPYCVPWYKDGYVVKQMLRACDLKEPNNLSYLELVGKYSALNLRTVWQYGTIEFRHLPNTHDTSLVMSWIDLILRMYQFSTRVDCKDILGKVLDGRAYEALLVGLYNGSPEQVWDRMVYAPMEQEIDMFSWSIAREIFYASLPYTYKRWVVKSSKKSKTKSAQPAVVPTLRRANEIIIEGDQREVPVGLRALRGTEWATAGTVRTTDWIQFEADGGE